MKNKQQGPVLVMAGGTGGHVMPALAVAKDLKSKGIDVHWLGTKSGIESTLVPKHDLPISYITIKGLRGKGILGWFVAPFRIIRALWQSLKIIYKLKPRVILSMGGYVAGPGGIAGWILRYPLVLHEQNAVSGLTNRLLSPFAKTIMTAFPQAFNLKLTKVKQTGNPVRQEFINDISQNIMPSQSNKLKILVLGGSLGARVFNQVLPETINKLVDNRPEIWHQAGNRFIQEAKDNYSKFSVAAKVEPFIEDMAAAYKWADLVICRAGALTIAEIAASGVPSILVPYPFAVSDHQTANARYLTDNNAAFLLPQSEFNSDKIIEYIKYFQSNPENLKTMGDNARKLAKVDATQLVANFCLAAASCKA